MAEPFLAEIRAFSFSFAPKGWAACGGQLLPINQNQALFSLLGTMYGGDGRVNFALPDFRGRTPIHFGDGPGLSTRFQGERGGEEAHVLTAAEIPPHTHALRGTSATATTDDVSGALLGVVPGINIYADVTAPTNMDPRTIATTGGSGHNNMQPYLTLNYCIALQGIFPSRDATEV